MILLSHSRFLLLFMSSGLLWTETTGQMLGDWNRRGLLRTRQNGGGRNNNGNNNGPDTSAFNIVNGRVYTPGLGIILAPQPFTPMGGDFLHIAIDVSGDGKLPVPPQRMNDPLTQVFNFTMFLTSDSLQKNFTISNLTTTTPPFADIMSQELGQTVKHINFEWPDCLVGDGRENIGATARGDYNISIHQNYRLNGNNHYSIFNLPISVTNSISQFPGANQLLTVPPPGPLNANGGRMNCDLISNPMMRFADLVASVNNPPGQPFQDVAVETTQRSDGGQVGSPGNANPNRNGNGFGNGNGNGEIGNGNNNQQIGNQQGDSQAALGGAGSRLATTGIVRAALITALVVLLI
ncbi:uncharacterized protein EI97DRAFT_421799 [Westerdykella ornata]|uniref:Uncharacterized protein n=1 Tax=Westerdykella ornata TaxID=318751 RepID=A0A6A6JDH6_WESOR|nr:uncharacterized protein EI97DRAFT_421799 [Westerdykella ornata]KAF2274660.1 hypothetical protein EI97DRAFT_421799 [Westerdykella ornata]